MQLALGDPTSGCPWPTGGPAPLRQRRLPSMQPTQPTCGLHHKLWQLAVHGRSQASAASVLAASQAPFAACFEGNDSCCEQARDPYAGHQVVQHWLQVRHLLQQLTVHSRSKAPGRTSLCPCRWWCRASSVSPATAMIMQKSRSILAPAGHGVGLGEDGSTTTWRCRAACPCAMLAPARSSGKDGAAASMVQRHTCAKITDAAFWHGAGHLPSSTPICMARSWTDWCFSPCGCTSEHRGSPDSHRQKGQGLVAEPTCPQGQLGRCLTLVLTCESILPHEHYGALPGPAIVGHHSCLYAVVHLLIVRVGDKACSTWSCQLSCDTVQLACTRLTTHCS